MITLWSLVLLFLPVLLLTPIKSELFPASLPLGAGHIASASVGDRVIFAGGVDGSGPVNFLIVISDNGSVLDTSNMPLLSSARYAPMVFRAKDEVWIMGGCDGLSPDNVSPNVDVINMTSLVKRIATPLPWPVYSSNFVSGGSAESDIALYCGGYSPYSVSNASCYYNVLGSSSWTKASNMNVVRDGTGVATAKVNGSLYSIYAGGNYRLPPAPMQFRNSVDVFNHSSRSTLPASALANITLSSNHTGATVLANGSIVYVIGGCSGWYPPTIIYLDLDVIDMSQLRKVDTYRLKEARCWPMAGILGPYIYVAGGYIGNYKTTKTVEIIDTRDWTTWNGTDIACIGTRGCYFGGSASTSKAVFFAGGRDAGNPIQTGYQIDWFRCGNDILDPDEECDDTRGLLCRPAATSPYCRCINGTVPCGRSCCKPIVVTNNNTPAIVGGVVVAIVLVALVVGLVVALMWRKKQSQRNGSTLGDKLPDRIESLLSLTGLTENKWDVKKPETKALELLPSSIEYKAIISYFMNHLDGKDLVSSVSKISAVINTQVGRNFLNQRSIIHQRLTGSPELFKKNTWSKDKDKDLRQSVINAFNEKVNSCPWNLHGETAHVLLVVHGTDASIAIKILKTGFTSLSALDAGWYGKGMYFSSSALYTLPYYAPRQNPALLLCLALPGNPYPVTEDPKDDNNNLIGLPVKAGYQSHYVVTRKDGFPCSKPNDTPRFDELVIEQEAQVVPFAIIEFDGDKLAELAKPYQREVVNNPNY